jgi:hypothetical protein
MKKLILLFMLALGAGMAAAQQVTASVTTKEAVAVFTWDEQSFDFGKVAKGKPVTHQFEFTNTGNAPLLITGVKASCGCTTPEWTKEPIEPGSTGFIKAIYNAANAGVFTKTVTVTSNAGSAVILTIKGEVADVE